jgi:hypothetical protein
MTMTKIRKPRNHALRMAREAAAQERFDRNIRKEREIGVHPKYLHSAQRPFDMAAAGRDWERRSREWDEAARSKSGGE